MDQPLKEYRCGKCKATVWENQTKDGDMFRTIAFDIRYYDDKEGEWKSTKNLRIQDIPKAVLVLDQAYKFLVLKEREPREESKPIVEEEKVD